MRLSALRAAFPFAAAAAVACASGGGSRQSSAAASSPNVVVDSNVVQVVVKSDYVGPLDIYLLSEGMPTRLGEISGGTERFILDPSQFDINDMRIVAVPVGGYGRASTGRLNVRRGDVVQFNIAPILRQSAVFIR